MIVITPLSITDAILTSSTVSEPDTGEPAAWNSGTTYALDDLVYLASTHKIYQSLQASNTNHDPADDIQGDEDNPPVWWNEVGPTNKYAMFDLLRNTQTEAASPLTVELTPGQRINSLAVLSMEADSVTITMQNDAEQVYSYTEDLNQREVFDWFDYFFEEFGTKPSIAMFDLPPYTGGVITVTLTSTSGTVKCGALVIGNQTYLGAVQLQAENDVLNFSRMERNFDGSAKMLQRRSIPKTIQDVFVDKSRINKIRAVRDELNAIPAVWSGLDDDTHGYFETLLILGFYRRFTINLNQEEHAVISLELEEI